MKLLALILLSGTAFAQQMPNAFKLCNEGCTITHLPTTAVLQFGTGATWNPSFTPTTAQLPLLVSFMDVNKNRFILGPSDPALNKAKEIDIQQTLAVQTVQWTDTTGGHTTTVPALAPPPPPPPPPIIPITTGPWTGGGVSCWHQKVTDPNSGKLYDVGICGPVQ